MYLRFNSEYALKVRALSTLNTIKRRKCRSKPFKLMYLNQFLADFRERITHTRWTDEIKSSEWRTSEFISWIKCGMKIFFPILQITSTIISESYYSGPSSQTLFQNVNGLFHLVSLSDANPTLSAC